MKATILRQLGFAALALCLLLVAGIGVTAYRDSRQFDQAQAAEALRNPRRATANRLLQELREADSNQISFLRSGRSDYLPLYTSAVERVEQDLAQLRATGSGKQQAATAALAALVGQKLVQLKQGLEARKHRGPVLSTQAALNHDQLLNEKIASAVSEIAASAEEHPEESLGRLKFYAQETWLATLLGCLVLMLLLSASFYALLVAFRQRERAMRNLQRKAEAADLTGEQWQTTLSSIGDAVLVTDAEGRVTFSNDAARALTGWSQHGADQVHLDQVFQIVDENTHEPLESPIHHVLGTGQAGSHAAHAVLMRRDGSGVPIDETCAPIRDGEGRTLGAVLVFRDITARRKMEFDGEETVRRYQAMLDSIGDGFIALDETFRFLYANAKAASLLGIGPEDLRGRVLWGEIPGLSNSRLGKGLIRAMRDKLPLESEEEHRGIRLAIRAYPGSNGLTIYLADVTVHRALAGDPSPNDERMQRGLRAAAATTWEYDVATRRMTWSDTAKELFGGPDSSCPPSLLAQMVRGPGSEVRVMVNGEERWLSWLGQAVCSADGQRRIAGILLDVTAQRQTRASAVGA